MSVRTATALLLLPSNLEFGCSSFHERVFQLFEDGVLRTGFITRTNAGPIPRQNSAGPPFRRIASNVSMSPSFLTTGRGSDGELELPCSD